MMSLASFLRSASSFLLGEMISTCRPDHLGTTQPQRNRTGRYRCRLSERLRMWLGLIGLRVGSASMILAALK
jgi:hypothetical protein